MRETLDLSRRSALLMLPVGLLMAGCATRVNRLNPDIKPISFDTAPIELGVERIGLVVRPRLTADETPVDADFVVPLEEIARLWPKQRLRAVGGNFTASYIIDDASAISRRADGSEVVVATMQVRLVIKTPYDVEEAETGARVESELRITGDPNTVDRQEMLHGLAISMADKLDEQMTAAIAKRMRPYISGGLGAI